MNARPEISSSLAVDIDRGMRSALAAARVASESRGTNIKVLDLRHITKVFDFFVIATGASSRQLHSMADDVEAMLSKELFDTRRGMEGYEEGRWIVIDHGDVIVHLFDAESRDYWDLENLWSDARHVEISPEPEVIQ